MKDYVKRLVKCGYTEAQAYKLCTDFIKNLPLFDLQFFIEAKEAQTYVD